jgi:hypothetical protein
MKKQTIIKALLIVIPLMVIAYWYWSKKQKEDEPTNENAQIPIEPVDNVPTLENAVSNYRPKSPAKQFVSRTEKTVKSNSQAGHGGVVSTPKVTKSHGGTFLTGTV